MNRYRQSDFEDEDREARRHPVRRPACELHRDKKAYNSAAAARRALENLRDYATHLEKKPNRVYECPGCHKHFLTSRPQ